MNRILVIRGGAIGDFILTLPALRALREAYPDAHLEILGYKHIVALAENRFYAQAIRSIEYGPLSSFFGKTSELPDELVNYFASFDLIVSYLYDPDRLFETNVRRSGVENFVHGPSRIGRHTHAAKQLATPIEELGIEVLDLAAKIFPSAEDRQFAREFLRQVPSPIVAIHPGSGSEEKNWPLEKWSELGSALLGRQALIIVSGEADEAQVAQLESLWKNERVVFAKKLPLPHMAAVLEQAVFIGHDSGISHLAAAAGANCILLFGPTDPKIWAPRNENVRVIEAPDGDLAELGLDPVGAALNQELMRMGIST